MSLMGTLTFVCHLHDTVECYSKIVMVYSVNCDDSESDNGALQSSETESDKVCSVI